MSEPDPYRPAPGQPNGPGFNAPTQGQSSSLPPVPAPQPADPSNPYATAPQPADPSNPYATAPQPADPSNPYATAPQPAGPLNPYATAPAPQAAAPASERVGRGLALALLAIPLAAGVAALIWRLGFIASISGFVLAGAAALLYAKGAGGVARKGIPLIIAIVVIGTVVSWFAVVATDLALYYPQLDAATRESYPTRGSFVADNLFYGPVLSTYLKDLGLFVLFAALGTFGVLRRLWQASRTRA